MTELAGRDRMHELLSFRVAEQEFCIDIMSVREIRGWTPATPLPHAPSCLRGVVNLRGIAVPVLDLTDRLGLGVCEPTAQHVIIVTQIGERLAGLLASAVCDIIRANDAMIQPLPPVASRRTKAFVQGLLTVDGRMVGLLRMDELLPDLTQIAA